MIIVKLWGGMCNQMFQYAFGYALAKKHNDRLVFDVDFYANQPGHVGKRGVMGKEQYPALGELPIVSRPAIVRLFENKYISHLIRYNTGCNMAFGHLNFFMELLHKHYSPVPYKADKDNYFDGYWQSADYFKGYEDDIRSIFTPSDDIMRKVQNWRKSVKSDCCVAVHIRRGDYLNAINKGEMNTIDDNRYYLEAISMMQQKFTHPTFCFFSDDIAWCRKTFSDKLPNAVFVENNCKGAALLDLFSIAQCEHGIMSPSTFSWWGNWLRNPNKNSIVIYPECNYADKFITNPNWIEIKN